MPSAWNLHRVALVRTDDSDERIPLSSGVLRLLVTSKVPTSPVLVILMMEAICSSETSVLSGATQPNMLENGILRSHCRKHIRSYYEASGYWVDGRGSEFESRYEYDFSSFHIDPRGEYQDDIPPD
jgi:hypothetical protein